MKKIFSWMLIALVGIAFSSCEGFGKKQTDFYLSDLQGKWLEDGSTTHYVCFTTESSDIKPGYLWAYEWGDFGDDVDEADVLADKYGNGWFMYQLKEAELLEIHKMNQGWGDIPKVYTVTVLTKQKLTYAPKDYPKEKVSFTKQ